MATTEDTFAYVWAVRTGEASYERWKEQADGGARTTPATRFKIAIEDDQAGQKLIGMNKRWAVKALHRSLVDLGLDVEDPAAHD